MNKNDDVPSVSTKTIVIGELVQKQKNPIVFLYLLNHCSPKGSILEKSTEYPHNYKFIELIASNYNDGCDLMFAYNDPLDRSAGVLYIGHWNDGVV
jgi:hypothetical protein